MKKILLLSTVSLAMLMADITLIAEQLTQASEPAAETTPTPTATGGIISNSVDEIVADMHDANTGWVSHMGWSGQFRGPVLTPKVDTSADRFLIWFEVEAAGNGKTCSPDINKAVNTAVEVGYLRSFTKVNNKWTETAAVQNTHDAGRGGPYQTDGRWDLRRCLPVGGQVPGRNGVLRQDDLFDNPDRRTANYGYKNQILNPNTSNGFLSISPKNLFRYHGWTPSTMMDTSSIQGVYGVVYMRLVKKDPNGVDDRDIANYVAHLSSDKRVAQGGSHGYIGDVGMSRYKKITKDWQPINYFSYLTEAQIRNNPPPIVKGP